MGVTSAQLEKLLSKAETFNAFFDGPNVGTYRMVDRNNKPGIKHDAPPGVPPLDFIRSRIVNIADWSRYVSAFIAVLVALLAPRNDAAARQIRRHANHYLSNLLFDRGLFPGFAPRRFFAGVISAFLSKQLLKSTGGAITSSPNGGDIGFDLFHQLTGVDLVITGANVTTHRPGVFSRWHTPTFPVAEAVGISMNLPLLFKPVLVEAEVPTGRFVKDARQYQGLWVDGGVLNNFPLHAFDFLQPPISPKYPDFRPLHPRMLGLRLTDGPNPPKHDMPGTFGVLSEHLGKVYNTVLYPSEEGQIRTPEEMAQTIDLYTYDLELTEFAPSAEKRAKPIEEAERAVNEYFRRKGG
jgi:NTE family protein